MSAQDELRRGFSDLRPVLSGALIANLKRLTQAVVDAERARTKAVERLAEAMGEYQHYAVELGDGVHLAVLVEDLRAALAAPTPCPVCGGAGVVDTSPPGVEQAPWLQTDIDCPRCGGGGEISDTDIEEH